MTSGQPHNASIGQQGERSRRRLRPGLLKVVLSRLDGTPTDEPAPSTASPSCAAAPVIRKAGVMAVVERGGDVVPGQSFTVVTPTDAHTPLAPV